MSAPHSDEHHFDCRLVWSGAAKGPTTSYEGYSREYRLDFEGKPSLKGSAAAAFRGDPSLHDPEDLFVASISACHCLSYLALCARGGVHVLGYEDEAEGKMSRVEGVVRFTEVMLHPRVMIAPGSDA